MITKAQLDQWESEVNAAYKRGVAHGAEQAKAAMDVKLEAVQMKFPSLNRRNSDAEIQEWIGSFGPLVFLKSAQQAVTAERAKLNLVREALRQAVDALSALVLNIDAGGATLGAMKDARSALANIDEVLHD